MRREVSARTSVRFSWLTAGAVATFDGGDRSRVAYSEVGCAGRAGGHLPGRPHRLSDYRRRPPRGGHLAGASRRAWPDGPALYVPADARSPLPFDGRPSMRSMCIDAWNHFEGSRGRARWWLRVLQSGAGLIFTDPNRRHRDARRGRDGGAQRFDGRVRVRLGAANNSSEMPASWTSGSRTRRPTCGKCHGAGATREGSTIPGSTARSRAPRRTQPSALPRSRRGRFAK